MNPLVTLLVILFLAEFMGIVGAVVAVPVAAAAQIVIAEIVRFRRERALARVRQEELETKHPSTVTRARSMSRRRAAPIPVSTATHERSRTFVNAERSSGGPRPSARRPFGL